jgi:two-component sensor histidine kinase
MTTESKPTAEQEPAARVGEARLRRIRQLERSNIRRKRFEERLKAALREKEILLREIHHRVKNNLQIIASLLRLGVEHVQDPKARKLFRDSHHRIRSIALIHEKLYQSEDMSGIPFHDYVRSLANELSSAHNALARRIAIDLDMPVMELPIDTAIPCGLIINELVTNALEHAFPETERAPGPQGRRVHLLLRRLDAERLLLRVSDNGVGMPERTAIAKQKSLGLELVATLSEQLGGLMEIGHEGGTSCSVVFPERRTR